MPTPHYQALHSEPLSVDTTYWETDQSQQQQTKQHWWLLSNYPKSKQWEFTNQQPNRPDISMGRGTMFREEGVDINQQYSNPNEGSKRPEMRGPQNVDLDNLLSGLKSTRDVNPQTRNDENESMVSISSLRDNQNTNMPKSTKRKQRSDKNIVSIDI